VVVLAGEPAVALETIRATADVTEVDWGNGFRASVYVPPVGAAAVVLDVSLRGSPDEGDVLRRVMMATTGLHGRDRLFYFHLVVGLCVLLL
jgi:hypothetical protein